MPVHNLIDEAYLKSLDLGPNGEPGSEYKAVMRIAMALLYDEDGRRQPEEVAAEIKSVENIDALRWFAARTICEFADVVRDSSWEY